MSKTTVTRLFIGSLIAVAAGTILFVAAIWLAIANDVFVMSGPDITGIHGSALAWSLLGVALAGGVAVAGGAIGGFVAWIGALLNTWRLESKTWFAILLLLGVFNLGFFAMIAYLIAGPDGTAAAERRGAQAPVTA
jgi:hypothetical protein